MKINRYTNTVIYPLDKPLHEFELSFKHAYEQVTWLDDPGIFYPYLKEYFYGNYADSDPAVVSCIMERCIAKYNQYTKSAHAHSPSYDNTPDRQFVINVLNELDDILTRYCDDEVVYQEHSPSLMKVVVVLHRTTPVAPFKYGYGGKLYSMEIKFPWLTNK